MSPVMEPEAPPSPICRVPSEMVVPLVKVVVPERVVVPEPAWVSEPEPEMSPESESALLRLRVRLALLRTLPVPSRR